MSVQEVYIKMNRFAKNICDCSNTCGDYKVCITDFTLTCKTMEWRITKNEFNLAKRNGNAGISIFR